MAPGYYKSVHKFGRSKLMRVGSSYQLEWQWKQSNTADDIIILDRKQYDKLKSMLLPSTNIVIQTITEKSDGQEVLHKSSSKNYMQIKRYLIRNKLLKETK